MFGSDLVWWWMTWLIVFDSLKFVLEKVFCSFANDLETSRQDLFVSKQADNGSLQSTYVTGMTPS